MGAIGSTYTVHLRLIGKRVVDFLVVLIEFFRYLLPLRRYERISSESRRSLFERAKCLKLVH